jgi:hypothetical protein
MVPLAAAIPEDRARESVWAKEACADSRKTSARASARVPLVKCVLISIHA